MRLDYKTHPSYGNIVLSKPSGNGTTLFGSKVKHDHFVSLEINEACISEDGFSEFIHGRKNIVSVYMSEAQWAHVVSSFGDGGGTPVTISHRCDVGYVERPPEPVAVIDLAKKSASDTKDDLATRLKKLEADVKKVSEGSGTVKRSDLKTLAMDFNVLASFIYGNLDFLENQVVERMEKEVAKAKIEIETVVSSVVTRLGERVLGEKLAAGEKIDFRGLPDGGN